MRFEWDREKNETNRKKHDIDFELAKLIFDDPNHVTDDLHQIDGEDRWITVGSIEGVITLTVVHTQRGEFPDETVRIISARRSSRHERKRYEQAISG